MPQASSDNPFAAAAQENPFAAASDNPFAAAGKKDKSPEAQALSGEQQVAESGAFSFLPSSGLLSTAIDVLRRPAYAVASYVDSALSGKSDAENSVAAAKELMSGIGGIEGRKVGFAQQAEISGVPEMGRLSDVVRATPLKWMYSETGEGVPFQIGGPLDPTGRGILFGAAEIPFDPSTYVSFGLGSAGEISIRGAGQTLKYLSRPGAKFLASEIERLAPKTVEGLIDVSRATVEGQAVARRAVEIVARSKAIDSEVASLTEQMIAQPIAKSSPLYRAVADAARSEAEERTIAAAMLNPKLLDRGGMKWMGWTIPYSPAVAAGVSGTTKAVAAKLASTVHGTFGLDVAKGVRNIVDHVGALWERDWAIRNLPGVKAAKVQRFDDAALRAAQLAKRLHDSGLPAMFKAPGEWEKFIDAWEVGNLSTYPQAVQVAAGKIAGLSDEMRVGEIVRGLTPEAKTSGVEHYWPHYYDNTPQELDVIFDGVPGYIPSTARDVSNLGRYNEARSFRTLRKSKEYWTRERLNRPSIPELKPVYDPDAWLRRISDHSEKTAVHDYYVTAGKMVGIPEGQWQQDVLNAMDLTRPAYAGRLTAAQARELIDITASIQKRRTDIGFVKSLSPAGKAEFLRQRFARVKSVGELTATMKKYEQFLDAIPRKGPLPNELASDGTHLVRAPGAVKELDGLRIPQSLANDIQGADAKTIHSAALKDLGRRVDTFNNIMRTGVYSLFAIPANYRNKVSNVATGIAAVGWRYIDPRLQGRMLKLLGGMDGEVVTALGERYSYAEIRNDLLHMGMVRTGREKIEQTAGEKLGSVLTKGPRWSHWIAAKTENGDLAAHYMAYLENGFSREQAAAHTKQWMIDYGDLSAFDREVMRRFFLFPTYPKRTIVNQARFLLQNPGRASALYSKMFIGRDTENRDMTTWEADALKIRLDRNGKNLTVLTGADLPIRQLDLLWRGSLQKTASQAAGMLSPPVKIAGELASGVNFFTGKPFTRKRDAELAGRLIERSPEWLKNLTGFKNEPDAAGRPHYSFNEKRYHILVESWAFSRIFSTTDRQFREYLKDDNYLGMTIDLMTGMRAKTLNLDEQRQKMWAERKRMADEALIQRGEKREFTSTYTPKEGR